MLFLVVNFIPSNKYKLPQNDFSIQDNNTNETIWHLYPAQKLHLATVFLYAFYIIYFAKPIYIIRFHAYLYCFLLLTAFLPARQPLSLIIHRLLQDFFRQPEPYLDVRHRRHQRLAQLPLSDYRNERLWQLHRRLPSQSY